MDCIDSDDENWYEDYLKSSSAAAVAEASVERSSTNNVDRQFESAGTFAAYSSLSRQWTNAKPLVATDAESRHFATLDPASVSSATVESTCISSQQRGPPPMQLVHSNSTSSKRNANGDTVATRAGLCVSIESSVVTAASNRSNRGTDSTVTGNNHIVTRNESAKTAAAATSSPTAPLSRSLVDSDDDESRDTITEPQSMLATMMASTRYNGNTRSTSTPLTAFVRTQTVEAFPVYPYPSVPATAATTNSAAEVEYGNSFAPTLSRNDPPVLRRCKTLGTICWSVFALIGIGVLLVGGGYCASGACQWRSASGSPAENDSSPPLVTAARSSGPSRSPAGSDRSSQAPMAAMSPSPGPTAVSDSTTDTTSSPTRNNDTVENVTLFPSSNVARSSTPTRTPSSSPTKATNSQHPSSRMIWTPTLHPTRKDATVTSRREGVAEFIKNVTLSARPLRSMPIMETITAEELALHWLLTQDPLVLWSNRTSDRRRLEQRYSLLTLWFQQDRQQKSNITASEQLSDDSTWRNTSGWLESLDECSWFGVMCTSSLDGNTSVVREILLDSNNLIGTLPADLGLLTSLVRFSVYNNTLTGTLPPSIGAWTGLEFFRVAANNMTGTIPNSIASWHQIYFASFNTNDFHGTMPSIICNYPNLTYLVADCGSQVYCPCCHLCWETITLGLGDD